jgi:hypothetical protein
MGEIKKYTDIVRLGHKSTENVLNVGDCITITEKLDGANASFILNESGSVDAFSRKQQISEENTLRGYFGWINENVSPELLNPKYRYYGEWLCSHKIQYRPEFYQNFYMFNVYDEELGEYLSDEIMKAEAMRLGIKTVPYLYEGEYISFEHLLTFVGVSDMALDKGEGIVVKNVKYKNRYGCQMFVKLVTDEFREIQRQKAPRDPNRELNLEQEFVNMCLTTARVDKLLHKLIDDGILDMDYGIEDMGTILKNLGSQVYEDIIKEESDSLPENYEVQLLRKAIGGRLPKIVKEIISNKS